MWKPMLPTLSDHLPYDPDWQYEVKYDGFRATLIWTTSHFSIISRNGKDLTENFPEIKEFCLLYVEKLKHLLPLHLDGELVILNTPLQANFPLIQQRGRTKLADKLRILAKNRPASFLCFDLLQVKGRDIKKKALTERKKELAALFDSAGWEKEVTPGSPLGFIHSYREADKLWEDIQLAYGEGIVAKRRDFSYEEGKRVVHWLKVKNWRRITAFITGFDPSNQYFTAGVMDQSQIKMIGVFKHGFSEEEYATLTNLIYTNGQRKADGTYTIPPGICVEIFCLHAEDGQMREPYFHRFRFDLLPEECTLEKVNRDLAMLPDDVEITNPEKTLWPKPAFSKIDMLIYLRKIAPYMLPRIKNKRLTLIRFPHGVRDESFFQKHRSPSTPEYVDSYKENGEEFIICNNVQSLIWLGNQGTIEYHVPFQRVNEPFPDEIVFDLDPPTRQEFSLAIKAALLLKEICDVMEIHTLIKTSGNKGLQIHIPLPKNSLSFEETRIFTEAVANLLISYHPELFTIERLKKNRGNRLYIDYVQHAEGKTIIAPYSPRAREEGTVATPLFWEEVKEGLLPIRFTIDNVVKRVEFKGCPWINYEKMKREQNLDKLKSFIHSN
jgi:bifunctional non-homologous end joining protein LigD